MTIEEVWEKFKTLDELNQKVFFAYLKGYLGDESFDEKMNAYFEFIHRKK